MGVLMRERGIVADALPEHSEGRHLDVVRYGSIEGLVTAMPKVRLLQQHTFSLKGQERQNRQMMQSMLSGWSRFG